MLPVVIRGVDVCDSDRDVGDDDGVTCEVGRFDGTELCEIDGDGGNSAKLNLLLSKRDLTDLNSLSSSSSSSSLSPLLQV